MSEKSHKEYDNVKAHTNEYKHPTWLTDRGLVLAHGTNLHEVSPQVHLKTQGLAGF